MLSEIGKTISEDTAVGEDQIAKFGMTPQEATDKIKELFADKAWLSRYERGDRDAFAQFDRLSQIKNAR